VGHIDPAAAATTIIPPGAASIPSFVDRDFNRRGGLLSGLRLFCVRRAHFVVSELIRKQTRWEYWSRNFLHWKLNIADVRRCDGMERGHEHVGH
jgi:hypothetical protein